MTLSMNTTTIIKILTEGSAIFVFIQGLKNFFPGLFPPGSKLAQIIAAVAALLAGLIPCFSSGFDVQCVINAVLTFLTAIGVYHSVAQSGGSVLAPLPPEPSTQPPPKPKP